MIFSLYPAVNYGVNGEIWPIGKPDIYIGNEIFDAGPRETWFGLIKLTILPPKHLLHPVLGQLINNKLLFHLCTKCAKTSYQDYCPNHADNERLITGTFCTMEIFKAVEMGYKVFFSFFTTLYLCTLYFYFRL